MNWLQILRNRYGLGIKELAIFLKVSPSTVNMCEHNKRDLPTTAMLMLAPFLVEENTALKGEIADRVADISAKDAALAAQQAVTRQQERANKKRMAQDKLATMQKKFEQANQSLQLISRIQDFDYTLPKENKEVFIN